MAILWVVLQVAWTSGMRVFPGEECKRWLREECSVDCAAKHSMASPCWITSLL